MRPSSAARDLNRRGPETPQPGKRRLRRVVRRILLRLVRPATAHQQMVNSCVLDAVEEIDRRLREQERLQLGMLADDLCAALESLRSRVREGDEVVAGSRAIPYTTEGALELFREPEVGVVLGYRNTGDGGADAPYRAFEEVFRGPEKRVAERQRVFLTLLRGHEPVLDVGCGRGEFLDLLRDEGMSYMGVDIDLGMVERCRAKGHGRVIHGPADGCLGRLDDGELGAVFSAQVIEHMPYADLMPFLELSQAKLRPGGIFIAETVNPHAPHALKTFWVDPSHQHPLFPEVAIVLCRIAGFGSAYVFHPFGSGHVDDDRYTESEYVVVATRT
jgi:SAM-dependent methyltransferase